MTTKVGINGFGRIGRLVFRAMADDPEVEVIAVNDLGDKATAAHLLKYDSIHGIRNFDIEVTDDGLVVDGKHVTMLSDRDPANLPWGELGVDVVVEATGIFKTGELAQKHLDAGAKKVVITCPAKDLSLIHISVRSLFKRPSGSNAKQQLTTVEAALLWASRNVPPVSGKSPWRFEP